ncbi:MAG: hypothetical protein JWN34_335 [Bryobacterales bacterium]|nr:hypothetical protein [Bryobacterales bacterium]
MKNKLLALALITVGSVLAQVSVGIQIGPPPRPRVMRVHPVGPGPGYVWVDGYYYPVNRRYVWHDGYWTRPPYAGAAWIRPRYERGQFFQGYWEGNNRERYAHDHRWDRDRNNRDYNRNDDRRDDRDRRR